MDEIEQRLRAATDTCVSCQEIWRKDPKDAEARSNLTEAVHELRKIAARLEIEMAVSERNEMAARPIPIPPHRSSRKASGENMHEDNIGNASEDDDRNSGNRGSGGGGGGSQGGFRGPQGGGQGGGQRGGPRRRMGMSGPQGGGGGNPGNGPSGGGSDQG